MQRPNEADVRHLEYLCKRDCTSILMTKKELAEILDYFPEIELPVSLAPDSIKDISSTNKHLPERLQLLIFSTWEEGIDEDGEIIPCFELEAQDDFYTIVYWKANLLSHEFVLATISRENQTIISKKIIAGLISDGDRVVQSVANIQEDNIIHIMAGEMGPNSSDYNPLSSNAFFMEILPGGNIYSQKEDQPLAWVESEKSTPQD